MEDRSRRTTLGIVPSTFLNRDTFSAAPTLSKASRASMGPVRIAAAAPPPPANPRMARASVAAVSITAGAGAGAASVPRPSYSARKSSVGPSKALTEDPRLAEGPKFVAEAARDLARFLEEFSYPGIIPPRLLTTKGPLTTAEFEEITSFIIRQIDPTWKSTKFSVDVPEVFKLLRCVQQEGTGSPGTPPVVAQPKSSQPRRDLPLGCVCYAAGIRSQ